MNRGIIRGFQGFFGSGIAYLLIEGSVTGIVQQVPCENGATVRALESAFGDVIGEGHCVDPNGGHVDQEVYWSLDEYGLILEAFTPVDQASPELVEAYGG